jgi:nitrate/nitrite-specific signal transduction histidine kinase
MNSTEDSTDGRHRPDPVLSMQNRLRLTARVAVSVSLVSAIALAIALYLLLRDQPAENYYQIIQSLTRSQERLTFAMVTVGALTILLAGLLTWIITLYSSHRVAGPLYRFSKNLELEIERGPVATTNLRKNDDFQALSNKLGRAAAGLSRYYGDQLALVDELSRNLESAQRLDPEHYQDLLRRLADTAPRNS